jgi:hypothetical protein
MFELARNPEKAVRKHAHVAVGLDEDDLSEESMGFIA